MSKVGSLGLGSLLLLLVENFARLFKFLNKLMVTLRLLGFKLFLTLFLLLFKQFDFICQNLRILWSLSQLLLSILLLDSHLLEHLLHSVLYFSLLLSKSLFDVTICWLSLMKHGQVPFKVTLHLLIVFHLFLLCSLLHRFELLASVSQRLESLLSLALFLLLQNLSAHFSFHLEISHLNLILLLFWLLYILFLFLFLVS